MVKVEVEEVVEVVEVEVVQARQGVEVEPSPG